MHNNSSFTVYNASAGSGKTHTLVEAFLKLLLQSDNPYLFKNTLAITFTNKAVTEMKDRIINRLKEFSDVTILDHPSAMFGHLCSDLSLAPEQLHLKAKNLLHRMAHNYAGFNISTIDGFTHNLIRTFAFDLKLPLNFEVELDQDSFLNEAINSLIARTGEDKDLTKILVDFAIEKADEDKHWDIVYDLNTIGKLLFSENDSPYIRPLSTKSLLDFKDLKQHLSTAIRALTSHIIADASHILNIIREAGLEPSDFSSGYLPKHFSNLSQQNFDINFNAKWQEDLEQKTLYPKRVSNSVASTIDALQPQIVKAFNDTKRDVYQLKFSTAFYRNLTPLSVLNAISNEIETLKAEQNKILISEFNSIISHELNKQPIPFIYERLGEKIKHYFIDEFQDTSKMQWENLIPLLENTLSSENGSVMIVGDAKQAIYRWRGGVAEQFIDLFNRTSEPFPIKQVIENLEFNYRSLSEIVSFNNGFFGFLSELVFSKDTYKNLYRSSHQIPMKSDTGYVELSFLNIEKDDDRDAVYAQAIYQTIQKCIQNGFALNDICILTRYKKDEKNVAAFLSAQEHMNIISEDGLLLSSSPEVQFLIQVLTLLSQPKNPSIKVAVLNHLTLMFKVEDKHAFFLKHLDQSLSELFEGLKAYGVHIDYRALLQLSLYDLTETLVRCFHLIDHSNAYIQSFMDVVFEFFNKLGSDLTAFLDYFDKKKDTFGVASPKQEDALNIMTIHKSKGLQFPVVIFPFADLNIYAERDPKEWYPLNPEDYNGFTHTLLNFNADFEHYGATGEAIFNDHKSKQELDNINLLYVALTRAEEQLFILSKNENNAKKEVLPKRYSEMFIHYLQELNLWNDDQQNYAFGTPERTHKKEPAKTGLQAAPQVLSTDQKTHRINIVTKSGYLWDTRQKEAIEKGNLVHDIMAQIRTREDIDFAINNLLNHGIMDSHQAELLKTQITTVVDHPKLSSYFEPNLTIYNERDIITEQNTVFRPDRLVINSNNEAVIIDYKTGAENTTHRQQLQLYQDVIEQMHYKVIKKFLVYFNAAPLILEA